MALLDRYRCALLDMNGTFMFDQDRFGDDANFHATYRALGGDGLTARALRSHIRQCYQALIARYEDPARYDDFPSLAEGFSRFTDARPADIALLVEVFAHHECGTIPARHAAFIGALARTHRLGLVANVWAPKARWLAELERAGLDNAFGALIFSSDSRSMKPSPRLFTAALDGLGASAAEALFVGDSLRCDMAGAKAVGLTTVWIGGDAGDHPAVDFRIGDLLALKEVT